MLIMNCGKISTEEKINEYRRVNNVVEIDTE
jgi:hypothetical protein